MSGCRVIAHRGARAYAPENTLEAIDHAARQRADAVEVDVQLTRDGEVVVMHDDTLERTTDVTRRFPGRAPWWVSEFTAAEIATLDAGSWFVDAPGPAHASLHARAGVAPPPRVRVPTLLEVLDRCRAHGLALHVELKSIPRFPDGLVERATAIVVAHAHAPSTCVSSFDHRLLVRARELAATLRTAALVRDRLADPVAYLKAIGANALHPGCRGDDDTIGFQRIDGALDRAGIAALTEAGYEVNVWTENDVERMHRLIDAGVTGIFTDCPDRLREALDARGRPG